MHVVIMGCGRVGSTLAIALQKLEHTVAIVDRDGGAFERLPADFNGQSVIGWGFDRDTLREAGIEKAGAFAAVSSGDNSNIISARVARETFGVEHVVARIYDPRRAEVYERLGIPTVATVRWTADQMLRQLLPVGLRTTWADPTGSVVLAEIPVGLGWVGHKVTEIEEATGARVGVLTRLGAGQLPTAKTVVQQGDLFHFALNKRDMNTIEGILAAGPEGEAH